MNKKLLKFILMLLILLIYISYMFFSQSKFFSNIEVASVNLNITGMKYWKNIEATGFTDNSYKEIINTKEVLTVQIMGKSRSSRENKNTNLWTSRRLISTMF